MNGVGDEQLVDLFVNSGELRRFNELVCRHISKVRSRINAVVEMGQPTEIMLVRADGTRYRVLQTVEIPSAG